MRLEWILGNLTFTFYIGFRWGNWMIGFSCRNIEEIKTLLMTLYVPTIYFRLSVGYDDYSSWLGRKPNDS